MSLTKQFDDLDNLITNQGPLNNIKSVLTLIRDQTEALESEHATLKASNAALVDENAKLKASASQKNPPGDDFYAMENVGDGM